MLPEPSERWGAGTHLPLSPAHQPEVRGPRSVDCRDSPLGHRQDRQKPRKGIASPGEKLMWKTVQGWPPQIPTIPLDCSLALWLPLSPGRGEV